MIILHFPQVSDTQRRTLTCQRKNWRSEISYEGPTKCPTPCRGHLSSLLPSPLPLFSHFSFSLLPFPSCPLLFPCAGCECWHLFDQVAMGLLLVRWFSFYTHIFFKTQSCIFCRGGPLLKQVKILAKLATGNWNLFGGREKGGTNVW